MPAKRHTRQLHIGDGITGHWATYSMGEIHIISSTNVSNTRKEQINMMPDYLKTGIASCIDAQARFDYIKLLALESSIYAKQTRKCKLKT